MAQSSQRKEPPQNTGRFNLLAAIAQEKARNQIYNVAVGDRTTLNRLFELIRDNLVGSGVNPEAQPVHRDFRAGDVRHSQADISKARALLAYQPTHTIEQGLKTASEWYVRQHDKLTTQR